MCFEVMCWHINFYVLETYRNLIRVVRQNDSFCNFVWNIYYSVEGLMIIEDSSSLMGYSILLRWSVYVFSCTLDELHSKILSYIEGSETGICKRRLVPTDINVKD
jgi:hypothetical protein